MKDIVLDELIKEDKQMQRQTRGDRRRSAFKVKQTNSRNPRRAKKNNNTQKNKNQVHNSRRMTRNSSKPIAPRRNEKKSNQNSKPLKRNSRPKIIRDQNFSKRQEKGQQKGRTLKVLGLLPQITNEDLYKIFAEEGALERCLIEQDDFGRNLPSAIVKYHSGESAKRAIQNLNGKKVTTCILTVEPYKTKQ